MLNMLFELASDDLELSLKGQYLKGKVLVPSLKKLYKFERLIEWFERRRRDPDVLMFMLSYGINNESLKDRKQFGKIVDAMREEFSNLYIGETQVDEEHQTFGVELRRHNYRMNINTLLLSSPEFRELDKLYSIIRDLGKSPYKVHTKEGVKEVNKSRQLLDLILATAKKGLNIQRYKGLGEMKPQQLWETTMDPDKRTLLQVSVQDSVEADNIFTVLMGDQVEPRKEFITTHALEVRNVDI
jgi:DNA gyrase subunit B